MWTVMYLVTESECLKFICARFKKFGNSLIMFTEFQINKLVMHFKKAHDSVQRKVL